MRNYQHSDYAVNKFSPNIVYRFADSIVEVTLEDYLRDNPDKTESEFAKLKALSDEIYHDQDLENTRYGKRAMNLENIDNSEQYAVAPIDTEIIHKRDKGQALKAAKRLLESGKLTQIQERRFILHFFEGLSTRQIARMESVKQQSICDSLWWATKKLKEFFND